MEKPPIDIMWVLASAGLVFMMQAGFMCLESGLTRSKNTINVAIKNVTDFGIACLLFWLFGYGIMFGASWLGWLGTAKFAPDMTQGGAWLATFFLFQMMFCGTSTTIVSGAVAERMRFGGYIVVAIVLSGFIYTTFGHWAWNGLNGVSNEHEGWFRQRGFVDFAGSTVVHSVGGWVALAVVLVIGPRDGRFAEDGAARRIQGHDLPVAILGGLLLWFGWFGFNGGSTLAMNDKVPGILINTVLAGAAGLVTALTVSWLRQGLPDVMMTINGALAGLVAITASCHAVTTPAAAAIGSIGALVMITVSELLERWQVDDAVGAFPVHAASGIWGTLAVGLLGDPARLGTGLSRAGQIWVQFQGVFICFLWAFGLSFLLFRLINRVYPLRVTPEQEQVGLNVAEHGATTEWLDLFTAMDQQAKSGDLNLRVPVEPFTEVGQIAGRYNQVMDALQGAVAKTQAIVRSATDAILTLTKDDWIITSINPSGLAMFGYSQEAILGKPVTFLLATDDGPPLVGGVSSVDNEWTGKRADGSVFPLDASFNEVEDAQATFYTATMRDITERKRYFQAIRESEARTRQIIDTALDAVVLMDEQGVVIGWNEQAREIFGWQADEIIGKRLGETIVPPQYRESHERGLRHFNETGEGPVLNRRIEITAAHRDGHEFPVELAISTAQTDVARFFNAFVRDITQRKKSEALVKLLQVVAVAANEATTPEEAMQVGVDQVCAYTGWPVGHAYVLDGVYENGLVPTVIWYLKDADRFATFRRVTEQTRFAPGIGLPGRVLASGHPAWIMDVTQDANFPRAKAAENIGVKGAFGFPVLAGTETVAVLEFYTSEPMDPDEPMLQTMAHIGTQLGRVFERQRSEEALYSAKNVAEEANLTKSRFLANMSHELRTPLNAIIGYSEMLEEEAEGVQDDFIPDLVKIHSAGKHLLSLINEVLDLSKIEAGKMLLYQETFDLAEGIRVVATTIEPLANKNGNTLQVTCADQLGAMHADVTRFRQCLFNVLSNSCKFTQNGLIQLNVGRDRKNGDEWVTIRVSDSGIGMTPKQMEMLFQPFTQADASTTRKYGGTGLGMAITRKTCQLMGGEIHVDSELDKGTAFTLEFPIGKNETDRGTPATAPTPEDMQAVRGNPNTVLVIDDDPNVHQMMQHFLSKEGFKVVAARGGEEGLRMAREVMPIAITLDVMMPGLDGWMVLKSLKADPEISDIPVIMVTIVDNKNLGFSLGVTDYLTKPVNHSRLASVLQCYRNARQACRALVIDDDQAAQKQLTSLLQVAGWEVIVAGNGREGLQQAAEQLPDIALLDLMMPTMDGFQFVQEFRKLEHCKGIPIIVVTAKDINEDEGRMLSGQVQSIFQKGACSRDELLQHVRDQLARCVPSRSQERSNAENPAGGG